MRATTPLKNERGLIMAMSIFVVAVLLALTAAAHRMSLSDVTMSRNYRSAAQGLYAAEAGIFHAMSVINQAGVINLQNDFISVWGGPAPFGTASMPQNASYNYNVTLTSDPFQVGQPGNQNRGVLTSRSTGTDNAARRVDARIIKSDIPNAPPGAIYLATDAASNATFNGNNFAISGMDVNFSDGLPGPKIPVPGITTRTEANAEEARASLTGGNEDNVQGYGFVDGNPATPSVLAGQGPTTAQINQMINDLLALPHVTDTSSQINGGATFGTEAAPQITYLPGNGTGVTFGNGNSTGCGILIVENALVLNGDLDFKGLILVRGTTQVTEVTGSVNIWGSLWTTEFNLTVGGHADIQFSSEALALANMSGGGVGALPAPVKITAWRDAY
jgi:hypothetical protein